MSVPTVQKPAESLRATSEHAHWVPLLVFAALLLTGAAQRVAQFWAEESTGPTTGLTPVVLAPGTVAVLAAAGVCTAWFVWFGRAVGLVGRWLPAVLTWVIGALLLPVLLSSAHTALLPVGPVTGPLQQDSSLVVIAAGLLVLASVQRSRRLMVVAVVFAVVAAVCTYASPENQLYDVLGMLGVRDEDMPWVLGEAFAASLPGLVLLAGSVDAWRRSLRSLVIAPEPSPSW